MMFSKQKVIDDDKGPTNTLIHPTTRPSPGNFLMDQLGSAGLPGQIVEQVRAELSRTQSEDYTSNVSMNRNIDELPEVITALIDVILEKDGKIRTLTDKRGLWLDVLGTKGNIPNIDVTYHRRANISAILTSLTNDVYHIEYEADTETGELIRDEYGDLIIKTKAVINVGIEKRNLDALNNLAVDANTRDLQARIFGTFGGGSGIGVDGKLEGLMGGMFGRRKK